MGEGGVRTIDVHAHVMIPAIEALVAGRPALNAHQERELQLYGQESRAESMRMVQDRLAQLTDPGLRLADMDAAEVDIQIVSPSPTHYHYWAEPRLASAVCASANDGVARFCATSPRRLRGMGLVPLQHPELAVDVLTDAIQTHGLLGVEIGTCAPGLDLSSRRLDPLWACAVELGAVVFIHPSGCSLGARLNRWYLSNLVGNPTENAVGLSHLIFGGVFDRFPPLKVLAAHGGGYLPTCMGRADHGWQVREDTRGCARLPSSYMQAMWFDSLVFDQHALRNLLAVAGPDRVMIGSDYPFDMGVEDPVPRLTAAMLSPSIQALVRGGNAEFLFGLDH